MTEAVGGIVASGLRRSFGSVHPVRDVTFRSDPGRVTALIGRTGRARRR